MMDGQPVLESLEAQVDPRHSALLLVDVQNDFVHPEGYMGQRVLRGFGEMTSLIPAALDRLRRLLEEARRADVFTLFVQMIGDVVMAEDCCADYDLGRHEAALRKMGLSFGYVVPSDEIIRVWRGSRSWAA